MAMFTVGQVARMLGVRTPSGGRMDEWFQSQGIKHFTEGPKAPKGHYWFATDEAEILDRARQMEQERLHPVPSSPANAPSKFAGSWEGSKFVGNEALRREIQAINNKLDHLIELWENPKDKTF